ncbi:serine acetyltransferase [Kordia sp. SMS9]|uniref:serine O-acetyltransferase n=1 Tax=Kordia sp. SMS9 TaxID=2282170 RepID=UPI000E0D1516|nr:serine O-acetyltransferase [Kordia sp. SMS9]AXG70229.1 serine acetyltransferase [Kordia sp. SMS9]
MRHSDEYGYSEIDIPFLTNMNDKKSINKEKVIDDILQVLDTFCKPVHIQISKLELHELSEVILEDLKARVEQDPIALNDQFIYSLSKSFKVIFYYRIANFLFYLEEQDENLLHKFCAFKISEYAAVTCAIEIHPEAKIGKRFVIDHGINTLIGATSIIGDDCTLLQNVVLGARKITFNKKGKRHPTIGNNVYISGGVRLLGPIHIGDHVMIYPDCIVTDDIPDYSKIKLQKKHLVITKNQKVMDNKNHKKTI